jgi:hypothetical protein
MNVTISENVPMLVRIPDSHIFYRGICDWTLEVERMNQLTISLQARENPEEIQQPTVTIHNPEIQEQVPSISSVTSTASLTSEASTTPMSTTSAASAQKDSKVVKKVPNMDGKGSKNKVSSNKKSTKVNSTASPVEMILDSSDEEIHIIKSVPRRIVNWSKKAESKKAPILSSASSSDEDNRLIINEDIQLDDEQMATTSRHV